MAFIQFNNDIKIYYEMEGKGKKSIVLISGYRADHSPWIFVKDKLKEHFNILTFDNLGTGQTIDGNHRLTLDMMADATVELIRNLKLDKPHIIGQSMGGAIAQIIARKYGEEIDKLVLVNTTAKFNAATVIGFEALLKMRQDNVSFDNLFAVSLPWSFSSRYLENPSNISAHKSRLVNNPYPQTIENQQRQMEALREFNSLKWVHEINNQTLVIASENDVITRPDESLELAKHISNSQVLAISGGHGSIIESPDEVSREIIKFFGKN